MDRQGSDRIILRAQREGGVERWLTIWLTTCMCFYSGMCGILGLHLKEIAKLEDLLN